MVQFVFLSSLSCALVCFEQKPADFEEQFQNYSGTYVDFWHVTACSDAIDSMMRVHLSEQTAGHITRDKPRDATRQVLHKDVQYKTAGKLLRQNTTQRESRQQKRHLTVLSTSARIAKRGR